MASGPQPDNTAQQTANPGLTAVDGCEPIEFENGSRLELGRSADGGLILTSTIVDADGASITQQYTADNTVAENWQIYSAIGTAEDVVQNMLQHNRIALTTENPLADADLADADRTAEQERTVECQDSITLHLTDQEIVLSTSNGGETRYPITNQFNADTDFPVVDQTNPGEPPDAYEIVRNLYTSDRVRVPQGLETRNTPEQNVAFAAAFNPRVAEALEHRLQHPGTSRQTDGTGTAASLVNLLQQYRPQEFARIAADLAVNGQTTIPDAAGQRHSIAIPDGATVTGLQSGAAELDALLQSAITGDPTLEIRPEHIEPALGLLIGQEIVFEMVTPDNRNRVQRFLERNPGQLLATLGVPGTTDISRVAVERVENGAVHYRDSETGATESVTVAEFTENLLSIHTPLSQHPDLTFSNGGTLSCVNTADGLGLVETVPGTNGSPAVETTYVIDPAQFTPNVWRELNQNRNNIESGQAIEGLLQRNIISRMPQAISTDTPAVELEDGMRLSVVNHNGSPAIQIENTNGQLGAYAIYQPADGITDQTLAALAGGSVENALNQAAANSANPLEVGSALENQLQATLGGTARITSNVNIESIEDVTSAHLNVGWEFTLERVPHSRHHWDQVRIARTGNSISAQLVADNGRGLNAESIIQFDLGEGGQSADDLLGKMTRVGQALTTESHISEGWGLRQRTVLQRSALMRSLVQDPDIKLSRVTNITLDGVQWQGLQLNDVTFVGCRFKGGCKLELGNNVTLERCSSKGFNEFECTNPEGRISILGSAHGRRWWLPIPRTKWIPGSYRLNKMAWGPGTKFTGAAQMYLDDVKGHSGRITSKLSFCCDLSKFNGMVRTGFGDAKTVRKRMLGTRIQESSIGDQALRDACKAVGIVRRGGGYVVGKTIDTFRTDPVGLSRTIRDAEFLEFKNAVLPDGARVAGAGYSNVRAVGYTHEDDPEFFLTEDPGPLGKKYLIYKDRSGDSEGQWLHEVIGRKVADSITSHEPAASIIARGLRGASVAQQPAPAAGPQMPPGMDPAMLQRLRQAAA